MNSISVRRPLRMSWAIDGRWMSARGLGLVLEPGRMIASISSRAALSPSEALASFSGSSLPIFSIWYPSAWPTRTASPPSLIEKRRMASLRSQSEPVRPVAADTPFFMPFWQSLDQRSPHRLVVVLALSMRPTMSRNSSTRLVTRPWTSPTRNTVCLSPPLATVRRIRAGSNKSTEISEAPLPQVLLDQGRRPFGVVGLHRHEGDVDRLLARQVLHLGEMHGLGVLDRDLLLWRDAVELQPVLA